MAQVVVENLCRGAQETANSFTCYKASRISAEMILIFHNLRFANLLKCSSIASYEIRERRVVSGIKCA
jgi:hypothetical protein